MPEILARVAPPPASEPVAAPEMPAGDRVLRVALAQVRSSPMQPRRTFRDEQLTELMESIREHGVIQPLVVRRVNGTLELIAATKAGILKQDVPAVISQQEPLPLDVIRTRARETRSPKPGR